MPAKVKAAIWLVITAALLYSAWSLYVVAQHWGAPAPIALITSLVFDGVTVAAAFFALKHTEDRAPGGGLAWLVTLAAAVVSVYLNAQHASIDHHPAAASVLYAFPATGALALLVIYARYRRCRTRPPIVAYPELPRIRVLSWLIHPGESWDQFRVAIQPQATPLELASSPGPESPEPVVVTVPRASVEEALRRAPESPAAALNGHGGWS